MKIVFLGTHPLAQIVLEKLITSQFKPSLVITGLPKKSGRGQALEAKSVQLEAVKRNIAISYEIGDIDDSFDLAILVAYGKIIPEKILAIPKFGFLNLHPSILPKYRGPSPIQAAILNADHQTGVSIMVLDKELDHGPILAQEKVKIEESHTTQSLTVKLAKVGARLLIRLLPNFLEGEIKPKSQDHSKATYTEKITKENGYIDLEIPPNPQKLDRMIRAFYPWPTVWSEIKLEVKSYNLKVIRIKLLPPTILQTYRPTDPFVIQPEGKRPLTISEFKNGYPEQFKQIENLVKRLQ